MKTMKKILTKILTLLFTVVSYIQFKGKPNIRQVLITGMLVLVVVPTGVLASGNGVVIMNFDDSWSSVYSNAYPIMQANNQPGVVFAYPSIIGVGTDFMSLSQLQALYNSPQKWDISSHSYTHGGGYYINDEEDIMTQASYLIRANNSELKHELSDSKDWLDNNLFTRSSMFFAYPFGTYDNTFCIGQGYETTICGTNNLVDSIKSSGYYIAARSTDSYVEAHGGLHPKYTKGDANVLKMATISVENNTYPQVIMDEINATISEDGLLILLFHKIVDGQANSGEYNKTNFSIVSNYLKTTSGVSVKTFSEYFEVPNPIPTYNPGIPIEGQTKFTTSSINITWTDGPGDKTNVFDILVKNGSDTVGKWSYDVVNRFVNITGLTYNIPVNVEVYPINRSWGRTNKNPVPLVVNKYIPLYKPAMPIDITILGNLNLTWTKDLTGNKTDSFSYNINGVWNNKTSKTFYELTGSLPGTYLLYVYGVNSTYGDILSEPLIYNIAIGVTGLPIITGMQDSKNLIMKWEYIVGPNTDSVEWYYVNDSIISTTTNVSKKTGETGNVTILVNPHENVTFYMRGYNMTTRIFSSYENNAMRLNNNPVTVSIPNFSTVYVDSELKFNVTASDIDSDSITFSETGNGTINSATGEFKFNETSVAKKFNVSITGNDGFGSQDTIEIVINVENKPSSPSTGSSSSGSGGGGASMGSEEDFSNIVKFEKKDGFIQVGKDLVLKYTTLNPGIYEVILNGQSEEINVRIENLKGHQKVATDVSGNVLLYTNVMINSARITGFSFNFKLAKNDVTNVDKVKVYVWNNGTWVQLDTKVLNSDANSIYFHVVATPAKLSRFAISETIEQQIASISLAGLETSDNGTSTNSSEKQKIPGFEGIVVIVALSILYIRRKL